MRIAIFGGTGFLGYDFVRLLLDEGSWEPVVYCTSPMNLANLRRHAIDIRFVPPANMAEEKLDSDIDTIVNFAHPFSRRDGLAPNTQTDLFVRFLLAARKQNDKLRMVHVSTMSVYEPFAPGREFEETAALHPPAGDSYATAKLYAERAIRRLPDADAWQLILRPTVIYGPFCRPWTDGPLQAFSDGDVGHCGLSGRIQPIWGHDISRFIRQALAEFRPGIYNMAGEHTVTWMDFLEVFQGIVGKGELKEMPRPLPAAESADLDGVAFYMHHLQSLRRDIIRHPSFLALGARAARHFPRAFVTKVENALGLRRPVVQRTSTPRPTTDVQPRFAREFFSEDRLISRGRFVERHPEFRMTPLSAARETLRAYYEYRFTDKLYV